MKVVDEQSRKSEMSDDSLDIFTAKPEQIDADDNIIATYYVEGRDISIQSAAVKIAAEESIGTWTEITTVTEYAIQKLSAKAYEFQTQDGRTGIVKIAYPLILFDIELGGIPNILSITAGNLFGSKSLDNVRLIDIDFPRALSGLFKGPKFGIEGVRRLVGTERDRRPHIGTIIKPKVGLSPKETAQVAYEAAIGGVDFIKDDETLTDQKFCPLYDRITHVMEALDKVKSETGRTVLYSPDITAETYRMMEIAEKAISHGANFLMLDVVPCGYSAIRMLAEDPSINVPLHIHRTGHGAFTRNPKHGIALKVVAKFTRLVGGDQLHTGTAAGKMVGEASEVADINNFVRGDFLGFKTTMPVASGGIHPGIVGQNIEKLGNDIVIQAGGGIHGHPQGTRAGATAMRQAVDAALRNISQEEYSNTHNELKTALEHFGRTFEEKE